MKLRVVKLKGYSGLYFDDYRLEEYRNIKNPHIVISYVDYWYKFNEIGR